MNNTLRTMLIFISAVHLLALPSIAQDIPGKDLGSHSAASTLRQKSQKPNKIAEDIWKKRLGETENVFRVSGQILLAGQPSESDFSKVAKAGFKRVLNLNPKKNLGEESRICRRLWLDYYHLSFDDETQLSDDIFNQVRQFLVKSKAVPVLVHCESNDRSAAVWAAYRTLDQGIDLERSIQEARAMGLKTDGYEAKLREYVSRMLSQPPVQLATPSTQTIKPIKVIQPKKVTPPKVVIQPRQLVSPRQSITTIQSRQIRLKPRVAPVRRRPGAT